MISKILNRKKTSPTLTQPLLDVEHAATDFDRFAIKVEKVERMEISEETAAKIVTVINNSVIGLVGNINGFTVSNYCSFIERYFPINKTDWAELKEAISISASKGPKIYLKVDSGVIDKKDDLKLIAFIKHKASVDSISGEIQGNIRRPQGEQVFKLEGSLQLPSLDDCVLRIEVKKVKEGETRGLVASTEIPLETLPSSSEVCYQLTKERKLPFSSGQEDFGQIRLKIRKDLSEEDPNKSVPDILKTYFIERLSEVLKVSLERPETGECPSIAYYVTASPNIVKSQSSDEPYQKLITQAGSQSVEDQTKFRVNSIISDQLELGLEGKSRRKSLFLSSPRTCSPALSPSQSMVSLPGGGDGRSGPRKLLESVKDSLGYRNEEPVRIIRVSKLLPTLHQHNIHHETLPHQDDISWDLKLAVSSHLLFSLKELEHLHQNFILNTIEELSGGKFDGKLSTTDHSILRILTGFSEGTSREVEQMITQSFISSYNKVPFDSKIISDQVRNLSNTGKRTEAVDQFLTSCLRILKTHQHVSTENLKFAVSNLKTLKEKNMLDLQQVTETVCLGIENEFYSSQSHTDSNSKVEFCRDFLISYVMKEMAKDDYQKKFDGILNYKLVAGDKYLSLCETLVRTHLPERVRVPLRYNEEDPPVRELRLVLDIFYNLRRIWRDVHPSQRVPEWIFSLFQDYPEAWIDLAVLKADVQFGNLTSHLQQKNSEPDENHKTLVHSVSQDENEVLFAIVGIIESCWKFREDLDWLGSEVNIRTGIKLMKDLSKSENKMLKLLEDIHLADEEYEAHELAKCLNLIAALLNRHDQTITEISKLHQDIASDCSGEDCDANVSSYKTEMKICFEEIEGIRTTLKDKRDQAIQLYVNKKRKTMTRFIKAKDLINNNYDDDKPTLMKYVDEECMTIFEKFRKKGRRSQIILSLWKVMEEEISEELIRKRKRNLLKNKPSRFYYLKEALETMKDIKTRMKDDDVILALELDRLENMLQEVIVLSDDTNTLISKFLRKKAESTVVDFEDSNTDGIKLGAKLAFTPDTGNLKLECIHVKQVLGLFT